MPILANAKKALRVSKRRAASNNKLRSQVKTTLDKVKKLKTGLSVSEAFSTIDKAVKQNLMHKNKAARLKSQMARLTKGVQAVAEKVSKQSASETKAASKAAPKTKTAKVVKSAPKKARTKATK